MALGHWTLCSSSPRALGLLLSPFDLLHLLSTPGASSLYQHYSLHHDDFDSGKDVAGGTYEGPSTMSCTGCSETSRESTNNPQALASPSAEARGRSRNLGLERKRSGARCLTGESPQWGLKPSPGGQWRGWGTDSDLTFFPPPLPMALNTGQAALRARGQGSELCGRHVARKGPEGLPTDRPAWAPVSCLQKSFSLLGLL